MCKLCELSPLDILGVVWPDVRASDLGARGRVFDSHSARRNVSDTFTPQKVLVIISNIAFSDYLKEAKLASSN